MTKIVGIKGGAVLQRMRERQTSNERNTDLFVEEAGKGMPTP